MNDAILANITTQDAKGAVLPWFDYNLLGTHSRTAQITRYIEFGGAYILAPFGIVGSVLTLLVLRQSNLSDSAFSFYLPIIAIFDGVKLVIQILFVLAKDLHFITIWFCKIMYFLTSLFGFMSFLLVVSVNFVYVH